jgi:integrase
MASIEKRTRNGRTFYLGRTRDPSGRQITKSSARKGDIEDWLAEVEHGKRHGTYIDRNRSKIKMGEWAQQWLAAQSQLKPSTYARYAGIVTKHVLPRWERVPLAEVEHAEVAAWLAGIDLKPASVHYIHRVFSLIMELAVRDKRLTHNPANGVKLSKVEESDKRYLTKDQLFALADECPDYRAMILVLGYSGLRFGELAALRVRSVNLMRGRLSISEAVSEVAGRLVWGTPKTHQKRSVPIPRFLCEILKSELAGKSLDDLVFTTQTGKPLRNLNWRRDYFDAAAAEAGLEGLTPHELRHTAASLAVAAGANVKLVQRMLGHKSAVMTLDVYSDLFDDDLDALAERLDASAMQVEPAHNADVIAFPRDV